MVDRIEEEMIIPFVFNAPAEFEVEETAQGVAIIKGVLLREGVSTNGNLYTIDEMEKIAEQAEGMPIFFGVKEKVLNGIMRKNAHANDEPNQVGRIISAFFDKVKRVIRYVAEIVNTKLHPTMIEEVKAGWGVSIGGVATARLIFEKLSKKLLQKIINMKLTHIQLLEPQVKLGQDEARVNNVEIQETMIMGEPIEIITRYIVKTDGICGLSLKLS